MVPYREEMAKRHLKVTGDLGRVVFIVCVRPTIAPGERSYDIRNTIYETPSRSKRPFAILMLSTTWLAETIPPSMRGTMNFDEEPVINILLRNFSLEDVHVEGTERIAEAVAKYDVDRFIHVSSYNADPTSTSDFFATKVFYEYHKAPYFFC